MCLTIRTSWQNGHRREFLRSFRNVWVLMELLLRRRVITFSLRLARIYVLHERTVSFTSLNLLYTTFVHSSSRWKCNTCFITDKRSYTITRCVDGNWLVPSFAESSAFKFSVTPKCPDNQPIDTLTTRSWSMFMEQNVLNQEILD